MEWGGGVTVAPEVLPPPATLLSRTSVLEGQYSSLLTGGRISGILHGLRSQVFLRGISGVRSFQLHEIEQYQVCDALRCCGPH